MQLVFKSHESESTRRIHTNSPLAARFVYPMWVGERAETAKKNLFAYLQRQCHVRVATIKISFLRNTTSQYGSVQEGEHTTNARTESRLWTSLASFVCFALFFPWKRLCTIAAEELERVVAELHLQHACLLAVAAFAFDAMTPLRTDRYTEGDSVDNKLG